MAIIQPFAFQFCTAFRERKQLADKVNEIIDMINNGEIDEELIERIDALEQETDNLESEISQRYHDLYTIIEKIVNPVWVSFIPTSQDYSAIFNMNSFRTKYDVHIRINYQSSVANIYYKKNEKIQENSITTYSIDENDNKCIDFVKIAIDENGIYYYGERLTLSTETITPINKTYFDFVNSMELSGNSIEYIMDD